MRTVAEEIEIKFNNLCIYLGENWPEVDLGDLEHVNLLSPAEKYVAIQYMLDEPLANGETARAFITRPTTPEERETAVRLFFPETTEIEATPEQADKLYRYAKLFARLTSDDGSTTEEASG